MTRAATYVRARHFEQQQSTRSADAQCARIEGYLSERDWNSAGTWSDLGADARLDRCFAFDDLLGKLEGIDKLVVVSLDRLGESSQRIANVMRRLRSKGVDLVAIEEGFDSAALTEDGLFALLAVLARGERESKRLPPSGWRLDDLRALGSDVRTVIDVGAADGTPLLYEAFPDAELVLIEPLRDFERDLAELTQGRGEYVLTAVGGERGTVRITVPEAKLMSSILAPAQPLDGEQREVPITTLDDLLEERDWTPPFGLKIDVEGYEHHVVEGAAKLLRQTRFLVAEVSLTPRFEGALSCAEFIELMRRNDFDVHSVIGIGWSPLGVHADLAFQPRARGA